MKRILTLTALLLIVALALTACSGSNEKEETVYDILNDCIDKTVEAKKSDSASVWEQALTGGSIEEVFTYEDDLIPIKTISGKFYAGKDTGAAILSMALTSGEKLDLSMFGDTEKAVIVCSALTGAYGVTADGLTDLISELLSGAQGSSSTTVTIPTESLEKHADKFTAILEKYIPLTMNQAESSMHFSFMITNGTVKQILGDVLTILENDAEFKQEFQDFLIASGEPATSGEMDEAFADAREALNDLDEDPFCATVSITASNERIISSASVTVYEGADTTGKQIGKVLFSLPASGGFNLEATIDGQTITAGYTVTEFGTVTKKTLSIGAMGITLTPISLTYDSANGDYELKIEVPGTFSADVSGKYTASATEATLTVTKIKATITPSYDDMSPEDILGGAAGGVTLDLPMTVTITAKASDTAPKAPASYKDLSKLSEEELFELEEALLSDPVIAAFVELFESFFATQEDVLPLA